MSAGNIQPIVNEFNGHQLTTIIFDGKPCWIAREVGCVFGYSQHGSRLPKKISGEWADEFDRGVDYDVIVGDQLADMKKVLFVGPSEGPTKFRNLTVLYETGIYMVCAKTNKPIGKKFRRWLVGEVLPQINRTGSYVSPHIEATEPSSIEAIERRMFAMFEQQQTALIGAISEMQAASYERFGKLLDKVIEIKAETNPKTIGDSKPDVLPLPEPENKREPYVEQQDLFDGSADGPWITAYGIALLLGLHRPDIRCRGIGMIAKYLGIKDDLSQARYRKDRWVYSPRAVEKIGDHIARYGIGDRRWRKS